MVAIDDVPLERFSFIIYKRVLPHNIVQPLESIALQLNIINKDKVHIEEHELMDLKKIPPSQRPDMLNAIIKEIQGLLELETFSLEPLPKGHRPLDSRIVLNDGVSDQFRRGLWAHNL